MFKILLFSVQLVMGCPSEMLPVPLALKVKLMPGLPAVFRQVPTKGLVAGAGVVVDVELLPPLLLPPLHPIMPINKTANNNKNKVFPFFIFHSPFNSFIKGLYGEWLC